MTNDALALARATLDAIGRERTELCELAFQFRDQLAARDATIAELREALRPFAESCGAVPDEFWTEAARIYAATGAGEGRK